MCDCHRRRLVDYVREKTNWTHEQFIGVDCRPHKRAYLGRTEMQSVRLAKFVHRWNPTMKCLHIVHPRIYSSLMCNKCTIETETQNHVYQCNHHTSQDKKFKELWKIEKEMGTDEINMFLVRTLTKGLYS